MPFRKDLHLTLGPYRGQVEFPHLYPWSCPMLMWGTLKDCLCPYSRKKSHESVLPTDHQTYLWHFCCSPQLKIFSINGAGLAVSGTIPTSVLFLEFLGLFLQVKCLSFSFIWSGKLSPVFFLTHCLSCSLILPTTDIWYFKKIKTKGTSLSCLIVANQNVLASKSLVWAVSLENNYFWSCSWMRNLSLGCIFCFLFSTYIVSLSWSIFSGKRTVWGKLLRKNIIWIVFINIS